jgi:hypothetical protein
MQSCKSEIYFCKKAEHFHLGTITERGIRIRLLRLDHTNKFIPVRFSSIKYFIAVIMTRCVSIFNEFSKNLGNRNIIID